VSKIGTTMTQFRDQPDEELRQALAQTRDDLFRLQLGQYTNQVTSTAMLTTKRRDIARILTVLRGRAVGTETQAQKTAATATETAGEASKAKKKTTKKAKSCAKPPPPRLATIAAFAGRSPARSPPPRWTRPRWSP